MEKIFSEMNVYEAFQERIAFIFAEFDNIFVSFSGGKDSGLLLNLVMQYMERNGIKREIGLFHQDFEAQYQKTTEYVERTFERYKDRITPYWVCLPMASKTKLSNYSLYWYPWDTTMRDAWVRPMPQRDYIINLDNNPFDFYKLNMKQEDLYKQFGRWYRDRMGGGKTIALLGMRADESLHRYSAIVNKRHPYNDKLWISEVCNNYWSASPLYDWTIEDVWTANGRFGFDYNRVYDMFYKAGVSISRMRVASPFNEWAAQALEQYRVIDPDIWSRLVGRTQGANFGAIYGQTKALGYKQVSLPKGHTWQSYAAFLLGSLPEDVRDIFRGRFGTADDESSWKRMCYCILKNDHLCRFAGFATQKEQQERINSIKSKYRQIASGRD